MNIHIAKEIEHRIEKLNNDNEVGTYEDLECIKLSPFTMFKNKNDDELLDFFIANKRKDNHKVSTYSMNSHKDLLEKGISEEQIQHIISIGYKIEQFNDLKRKIKSIRKCHNTNVKKIKKIILSSDRALENYYNVELIIKKQQNKRYKKGIFPQNIRNHDKKNGFSSYPSNARYVKLKSIIARNKKHRVFISEDDTYNTIYLTNETNKYFFNYALINSVFYKK